MQQHLQSGLGEVRLGLREYRQRFRELRIMWACLRRERSVRRRSVRLDLPSRRKKLRWLVRQRRDRPTELPRVWSALPRARERGRSVRRKRLWH
jgi:hypothetical protein